MTYDIKVKQEGTVVNIEYTFPVDTEVVTYSFSEETLLELKHIAITNKVPLEDIFDNIPKCNCPLCNKVIY